MTICQAHNNKEHNMCLLHPSVLISLPHVPFLQPSVHFFFHSLVYVVDRKTTEGMSTERARLCMCVFCVHVWGAGHADKPGKFGIFFFFFEEKISLSCQLSDASKRQIAHDVMWGTDLMVSWLWKAQQQCVSTHMQCVCMSACAHLSHLAGLGELADMSWICRHAFGSSSCQEPQRLPPPAPLIVGFFSTTIPGEMDFNVLFREFKHLLIASRLQV